MNLDFFKGKLLYKQWIIEIQMFLAEKENAKNIEISIFLENEYIDWLNIAKEKYVEDVELKEIEDNLKKIVETIPEIIKTNKKNISAIAEFSNRIILLFNNLDNKYNSTIAYNPEKLPFELYISEDVAKPLATTFVSIHEGESTETQKSWNEFLNKAEHKFKKKKK